MNPADNALPLGGPAKPAQNPPRIYETSPRDRLFLLCTTAFCVLLADTFFWYGPTAGLTAAVFAWYILLLARTGPDPLIARSNQVLLLFNLSIALTMALGSNWYFRIWNLWALLVLLPVHALALSGAAKLPWWRPAMLWERFLLLLWGLFGNLGAVAAVGKQKKEAERRHIRPLLLGGIGAVVLVVLLLPVLVSADALFAAATASLRDFIRTHFSAAMKKLLLGLVLTPFLFGLLYSLSHPKPLERKDKALTADALTFLLILAVLDALYLMFLAVQSAGLFGGPEYLAQRGISYADWARSGFFQMVGVTIVNLAVIMGSLTLSRREGRSWRFLRPLAALLVLESLVLLASAAWRMTLYVSVYGLSFKRAMTYWGMGMMTLFLLLAARKLRRPDSSFCRAAFPAALAGWLVINCVPVDYLVAKDQVDRYLTGESGSLSVEYLVSLSYDTLHQLDRLSGKTVYSNYGGMQDMDRLLAHRRELARAECADWRTWSLSACLAAGSS